MARVPYSGVQEVTPQLEAPQDYLHVQASPASFGAQVGEGEEALGQSALKLSDFYGQVAADNAVNNYIQKSTQILRGDPNSGVAMDASGQPITGPGGVPVHNGGYFSLRGSDAMSSFKDTSEDLDEALRETRESLQTPAAQRQFDNEARRYRAQYANEMGEHYDQQFQQWAVNTNTTGIALTQNQIASHLNDPDALAQDQETLRQYFVKRDQAQLGASDPKVAEGAILKADQSFYTTQIKAAIGIDPSKAQDILDKSGSTLASLPEYDGIVRQVKEAVFQQKMVPAVDGFVTSALTDAQHATLQGAQGGAAAKSSPYSIGNVKTASGGFAAPASPVDGVLLAANNLRSGYQGLTINQIAEKWAPKDDGNDPVAWAKNVARGSGLDPNQAPNLNDPGTLAKLVRGIGVAEKSQGDLAAFTPDVIQQGVQASLAGRHANVSENPAAAGYPSTADALNANMATYVDQARQQAEKLFPNYPDEQDRYVTTVERRLNQTVDQQRKMQEVNAHIVQAAMAGPHPPISEEQLRAVSPQVAEAWDTLQFTNPYVRQGIENRFDANAKGKALTFGANFKDYFDRAMAPASDPTRISDPTSLNNFVGAGEAAPLTNTGSDQLVQLMALRNTPQGEAFAAQSRAFVDQIHQELTFSNPTVGNVDPQGEKLFSKAMSYIAPKLIEAYKNGNLPQVLDPKNPDYLGNYATSLGRTPAQMLADRLKEHSFNSPGIARVTDLPTPQAQGNALLKEAVDAGRLTAAQAARISVAHGWFQQAPAPGGAHAPVGPVAPPVTPQIIPGYNGAPGG